MLSSRETVTNPPQAYCYSHVEHCNVIRDQFRSRRRGRLGQRESGHQIQLHHRAPGQRGVRIPVTGREDCTDG